MGSRLAIALIRVYQRYISPLTPPSCRFYPSCSNYSVEAISKYGLWRGGWLATKRLLRCHPFNRRSGFDPVP